MSASQLSQQIEIMTNPGAKYDASGNAGVINIKTKKILTNGFNGNINLSYGQGFYPKTTNSIMLNYRTSKIIAFLNYGYINHKSLMEVNVDRNFLDANGIKQSELLQASHSKPIPEQ
jgi:outer membrane receptor protein involved in Fe transport